MADVSHELGSLRFVVESPLSSKVAMFNNQVQQHKQGQLHNPFSADGRSSPKPTFSKGEYGKPLAGSLTEMRGQKANIHVMKEMLELCQIIDSEGYKVNDEPNMRVIPFGELFNIYNYISDKVVGILLRARKHKLVDFEGEMLFQRRDDNVPVFLLKPIKSIREELEAKIDEIKRASSPQPQATSLLLDKSAHQRKLQEAGLAVPANRNGSKSRTPSPALSSGPNSKPPTPIPEVTITSAEPEMPAPTPVKALENTAKQIENNSEATASLQSVGNAAEAAPTEAESLPEIVEASDKVIEQESTEQAKSDINNNDDVSDKLPTIVIEANAEYICTTNSASAETTDATEGAPSPASSTTVCDETQ